ncbi:MAG: protein kinase [Candidatus Sericytochromatia bacterium]|nr:protein kinase [Candidatus Sericytochromatia bacterium]
MTTSLCHTRWQQRYPEAWQTFQEAQANADASFSDFVHYLFQHKLISLDDLAAHYLEKGIEVTQVGSMSELTGSSPPPQERYALQDKLGQGAMGVVYLAKDQALLRQVAYKALLYNAGEPLPPIAVRRFLNEVQITAQLDHPHIIPIYQLLPNPDGGWGYTMKRIQGQTLKEILHDCRKAWEQNAHAIPEHLSLEALLEIFLKVCDALAYAHLKGVIHRDLKPANLMIGPHQEVYVMDWGIARRISDPVSDPDKTDSTAQPDLQADPDATQMGQILGTPRYMSPQQAAGKNAELDGRSDLFALGLILHEILTLQPAFQAPDQISLLKKVFKAELAPAQAYHPRRPVPAPLAAIVHKATARKPADRYASVADLAYDLRLWLQGEPLSAYTESRWEQSLRWVRKHAYTVGVSTLALISGCLLLIGGSVFYQLQLMQSAQHQQNLLASVFGTATRRAQTADQVFLRLESQLSGLIAAAEQALQAPPTTVTVYFTPDFVQASTAPPDFGPAPAYQRAVSLDWPGVQLAPGADGPQARANARQLMALRQRLWQIISMGQPAATDRAEAAAHLRTQGGDLTWAYIGLRNGLHLNYPGKGSYAADYDPRQRPWYQTARQQNGIFWGQPYADASGQGLLLPCLGNLKDSAQQHLGVAGLEISLTRFLQRHLLLPEHPEVQQIFLLDRAQRLLAQSANTPAADITVYSKPQPWQPEGAGTKGLAEGQSSHLQTEDRLWVSIFLPSIHAYYVLEIQLG